MTRRRLVEALQVVLLASTLTVALTYPLAPRLSHIGRVNTDDGRFSVWTVAWVAHALTTNPMRLYDANMFYPHPRTLTYSEANIGAGTLGAPVWFLTKNPHATHNFVVLLSFVLAFAGMYYLATYLSASRAAGMVAGVLFAFCPFIFARTAHIQLMMTGGLPWCMLAFHRLADRPTTGRSVTLGLLIWAQALSCSYYGIFAAFMVGLATIVTAALRPCWRSRPFWVAVALAAFISIGLTLPFFLPYVQLQQEQGFARSLADAREYAVNLEAWVTSAAWAHRWWLPAIPRFNEVLFPGFVTLILGVAGTIWQMTRPIEEKFPRFRRDITWTYLSIAAIAFWSSFGPDAGLYRLFYETIPIFSFLRAPGRMAILVVLALIVLGVPLLASLIARTGRPMQAGLLAAVAAAAELTEAPLTQFQQVEPTNGVYRVLAALPYGAVVEFPFWYERISFPRHAYYLLNSTVHWKPLVNGYGDHIPADFRQIVRPLSSFPSREGFRILEKRGARYVVFHTNMYDQRLQARLMERLNAYEAYLRPVAQDGPVWLYEIVGLPN